MEEKDFLAALGKNIRQARRSTGLRQEDVANECQFDKASISRIESGLGNPTILTLRKLATVLKVNVVEFFPVIQEESVK